MVNVTECAREVLDFSSVAAISHPEEPRLEQAPQLDLLHARYLILPIHLAHGAFELCRCVTFNCTKR